MRVWFLQYICFKCGIRAAVGAALICLVIATASSCRTIRQTEYVTKTEYVHDTTVVYIHDTAKLVEIRHDSVDRYVEKVRYVDTNGVVHEKEIERLTRYINESSEEYLSKEKEYKQRIAELESQSNDTVKEVLVERQLKWWQKTLMYLGVCFILAVIAFVVRLLLKLKIL